HVCWGSAQCHGAGPGERDDDRSGAIPQRVASSQRGPKERGGESERAMKTNPTLILCAAVLSVFVGGLAVALALPHPGWPVLAALAAGESVTIFVLYIVIHDAAHRSASKQRRLNEAMLFACGVVFLFDPYLYRRLHLTHHAHTNEDSDPARST